MAKWDEVAARCAFKRGGYAYIGRFDNPCKPLSPIVRSVGGVKRWAKKLAVENATLCVVVGEAL